MLDTTPSLRNWLTALKDLIEGAGFKLSPSSFSSSAVPKNLSNLAFSIDIQSTNTNKFRDDDSLVRVAHEVVVSVAHQIKPNNQFESLLDAADIEASMHAAILPRSAMPDTVITWVSTDRTLTSTREYTILSFAYDCEVDFPTGA